ncbi:hypothetical protein CPSG_04101 [Coccidioides posadasii str. Silveira]|uniref:Secreted protein n=1 Tax=Coccidioides posadasii (strain RMSCC 757 / Silveira) TaxID=443226 RepID=E9D1P3_COCPS|nr:hypothetical protein CPSG_04101 [Coccidioides posadasii str. Silveira]
MLLSHLSLFLAASWLSVLDSYFIIRRIRALPGFYFIVGKRKRKQEERIQRGDGMKSHWNSRSEHRVSDDMDGGCDANRSR